MGKKTSGTRCQQLLSLRQRLHRLSLPSKPQCLQHCPIRSMNTTRAHREKPVLQLGSSRTTHSPSPVPWCLNHPQAIQPHTSRMRTCKRSQSPTGGLHKGRMEHHNARIQQQQNSIEASQHKNPHCMFDFQPSQLWAAKNYRIYHSLLPNPALAFLF